MFRPRGEIWIHSGSVALGYFILYIYVYTYTYHISIHTHMQM